jgi:hypothetical protein
MSAAIKMIRAVRQSYYNDPESDRWPVPKMLCVVDGGKEFSQTFRTGFAAELGPQVEVKWQTVPAGNPNAGAGQTYRRWGLTSASPRGGADGEAGAAGGAESSGEGALYPPQGGVVASKKCAVIIIGWGLLLGRSYS